MKTKYLAAVIAFVVCSASLMPAVSADASARPRATLSVEHVKITAGTRATFKYAVASLPRGSAVDLQRQYGTGKVWKNVAALHSRSGSVSSTKLAMGHYAYRLIVTLRRKTVAVSSTGNVYSYGSLTVAQLCERSHRTSFNNGCDGSDTIQAGGRVFVYGSYGGAGGNTGPDGGANVTSTHSSCRSASLDYAVSNDEVTDDDVNSFGASMTQTRADEQDSTGTINTIDHVNFRIASSAWDLEFWTNTGDDQVFYNGTFSCWSSNGDS